MIGQDVAVQILRAIVRKNEFESAYMFSGPPGVGKTTLGRIFANAILCESPVDGSPCRKCESCKLFSEEKHFGYRELDAASYGSKDDMVKLRDDASFYSVEKKKIILIDECHDISKAGQDALLKQLEQCPEHLIYIFCTTDPDKMAGTLRDRCMEFQVSLVSDALIVKRLKDLCEREGIRHDDKSLEIIVSKSGGQVRNAIGLVEEVSYLGELTVDNIRAVVKDYDSDVCDLIVNLGKDLEAALSACNRAASCISADDVYGIMRSLLNDTTRLIYGVDGFLPERKNLLDKIKDAHGLSVVEFLDYLMKRDKVVDKVSLHSDLILLHYKFSSGSFVPQSPGVSEIPATQKSEPQNESKETQPSKTKLSHADLSKMDVVERSKFLRMQRSQIKNQTDSTAEDERVPKNWPLPKEEKIGISSFDDEELSPEQFSRSLVGGRDVKL